AALFAAIGVVGAALQAVEWTKPKMTPVCVSLLQGNIEQSLKFDPARLCRILETYARRAEESRARLIVLPETAIPRFLDSVPPQFIARLDAAARRNQGDLLIGATARCAAGF